MTNFIKSHIKKIYLNDFLIYLFIALIAIVFANTLLENPGMSITPWLEAIALGGGLCLIIAILKDFGILEILKQIFLERPALNIRTAITVILFSFLVALVIINTQLYQLLWVFILMVLGLFSFSIYLMFSNRPIDSICFYILSLPFVLFIEFELRGFIDKLNLNFEWFYIDIKILILLLLTSVWFIKQKFIDRISFRKDGLFNYILIFIGATFISVLFSGEFTASTKSYLFSVIYPVLIYFMIVNSIEKRGQIKKIIIFLSISVFLHILLNFYYYSKYYKGLLDNPYLLSYHAEGLSSILYLIIPLTLGLFIMEKKKITKCLYILMIITFLIIILYTFSRAALILTAFAFLLFSIKKTSRKYVIPVVCIILLISYFNFSKILPFFERYRSLVTINSLLNESSISNHLRGWRAGLGIFKDHPLTGVGVGMFPEHYHKYERLVYCSHPLYKDELVPMASAHHILFNYLSETGLIGAIPAIVILFIILKKAIFVLRKSSYDLLVTALCTSFFLFLIKGFTSGSTFGDCLEASIESQTLWIIIGLIMANSYLLKEKIYDES